MTRGLVEGFPFFKAMQGVYRSMKYEKEKSHEWDMALLFISGEIEDCFYVINVSVSLRTTPHKSFNHSGRKHRISGRKKPEKEI